MNFPWAAGYNDGLYDQTRPRVSVTDIRLDKELIDEGEPETAVSGITYTTGGAPVVTVFGEYATWDNVRSEVRNLEQKLQEVNASIQAASAAVMTGVISGNGPTVYTPTLQYGYAGGISKAIVARVLRDVTFVVNSRRAGTTVVKVAPPSESIPRVSFLDSIDELNSQIPAEDWAKIPSDLSENWDLYKNKKK